MSESFKVEHTFSGYEIRFLGSVY